VTATNSTPVSSAPAPDAADPTWTGAVRRYLGRKLPLAHLLASRQPFYVGSWVYIFGILSITSLIWIIASGVVLAFFGPGWFHVAAAGRFVNSIHFWSVQLFFIVTVLHLWGQFFMASWRDGRATTWIVGVVIFLIGVLAGFTGYISQQNLDAQWIALNAKDGVNAAGMGAFFNVLDFGQMYGIHVMLLPIVVTLLVTLHVVQVRSRGVVRPIEPKTTVADAGAAKPETER
jgi:quinol-cytochrome oxidoreductase complex cytochrome b subunit